MVKGGRTSRGWVHVDERTSSLTRRPCASGSTAGVAAARASLSPEP